MSKPTTSPSLPSSTTKRLLHELRDSSTTSPNNEDALLHLAPIRDHDLTRWAAVLKGPEGTPYEGGRFLLHLTIPPTYPLAPPKIRFVTPICHANIHFRTGEICLTLLTSTHWSPAYTLRACVGAVHQLLSDPDPGSPLNVDVARLLRDGDVLAAEALVRYYTAEFRWVEGMGFSGSGSGFGGSGSNADVGIGADIGADASRDGGDGRALYSVS